MASIITTTDLSVEDTSELKTGNTKRRHNMPSEDVCSRIKDPAKRRRCMNYTGEFAVKKNPNTAPVKKAPMSSGIKKSGY